MANTNDMNLDPISGAPGAHPVGVGLGGTGGAVAGAAIGSLLGPIGTLVDAFQMNRMSGRLQAGTTIKAAPASIDSNVMWRQIMAKPRAATARRGAARGCRCGTVR